MSSLITFQKKWFITAFIFLIFSALIFSFPVFSADLPAGNRANPKDGFEPVIPLGLDPDILVVPADNLMTIEKIELGKLLFFDQRLSRDNTIGCASCHIPSQAFTDNQPVSTGLNGLKVGRNAPTVINRAFSEAQSWDGRAETLEQQVQNALVNPIEHGFSSHDEIVRKLNGIEGYRILFKKVFGTNVTIEGVGKAIAAFERTVFSGNSPFDQFDMGGKENAISDSAKRGLNLFRDKARCSICHGGFNFTDEQYHNLGIGMDKEKPDFGRYDVSKKENDKGAFKTPTLREIAHTAPYMHDGRFKSLEEVVSYYNHGGTKNPFLDPDMIPLNLTYDEKKDLVAFLKSLSGEGWQNIKPPVEFPK